jgi:hypothetical protein
MPWSYIEIFEALKCPQSRFMKPYDIPTAEIVEMLKGKGLLNLYHANTLLTSNTFVENGHLLSRQYIEGNGLRQTPQYTDTLDKKFGIYNSIFLDFVDIHARARRKNHYGPILFVFAVDLLQKFQVVHITKRNPSKWLDGDDDSSRYYMSIEEFRLGYSKGDFDSMLILPGIDHIRFLGNLDHVYFDDPHLIWNDTKTNLCDEAIKTLKGAARVGGLADKGIKIYKRTCDFRFCNCRNQYQASQNTEDVFRIKN